MIIAYQDSIPLDSVFTDEKGDAQLLCLPVETIRFHVKDGQTALADFYLEIQLYQLLQSDIYLDEQEKSGQERIGDFVVVSGKRKEVTQTITRTDISRLPLNSGGVYSTVMDIEEVHVCSVRMAPFDKKNQYSVVIDRNTDRTTFNSQTPLIEGRTGGVNFADGQLHNRGARSDANSYFIDGVKVIGNAGIPHSAIQQINYYTGGLPANFGDVTGGVIDIRTTSYSQIQSDRQSRGMYEIPEDREVIREERQLVEQQNRFLTIYENLFLSPIDVPHSTFGIDVDQASWTFIRSLLEEHQSVSRDAVKLEEMINAFDYLTPKIPEGKPLGVHFERLACPWNDAHQLVSVQLKAQDFPEDVVRPPHNLVFLVDVSGSMQAANKLALLVEGLKSMVGTLRPDDRVALVTYAGNSGVVLPPTLCSEKDRIIAAINGLVAGGSTNGIGGIQTAYELAKEAFLPEGNNRIILATDGDFNVGISQPGELEAYISAQRGQGIYLTALGFGMGNYRNDILETLADRGDGNHFYISDLSECKQVLEERLGNILNLARDVKLNVEFNPKLVAEYRLIGYENRLMPSAHFRDDSKDGGEIGYGHMVTAVYEIVPGKAEESLDAEFLKVKTTGDRSDLCKVSLRYKLLEAATSTEETFFLRNESGMTENPLLQTIIAFGLTMRESAYKGSCGQELLSKLLLKLGDSEQERELKEVVGLYFGN
jgi:Ca-activated chloride channel family protein